MDYSITDFTVISKWEEFTKQCQDYLECLSANKGQVSSQSQTLSFRGYPLVVHHVHCIPRMSALSGLGNVGVDVLREHATPYSYIARCFDSMATADAEFLLVKSEEAVLSLASARLVTSSMLISQQTLATNLPIFVEYEEGLVMGVDLEDCRRFSLQVDETSMNLKGTDHGHLIRKTVLRHFPGVPSRRLRAKLCCTLLFHVDSLALPPASGGIDLQWGSHVKTLESLRLQTIFPQMDGGRAISGMLPDPSEAPIWLLSLQQTLAPSINQSKLCNLVRGLADLVRQASLPPSTDNPIVHSKARILGIVSGQPSGPVEPEQTLMRNLLMGTVQSQEEAKGGLVANLSLILLWSLQRTGAEAPGSHAIHIDGRLVRLWSAFTALLKTCWRDLNLALLASVSPQTQALVNSRFEAQLALLYVCIEREKSYANVPQVSPRTLDHVRPIRATEIFDSWADRRAHERDSRQSSYFAVLADRLSRLKLYHHDTPIQPSELSHDEEGEEFFDAIEEIGTVEAAQVREILDGLLELASLVDDKSVEGGGGRQGHKDRFGDNLMIESMEPIYVPFTQVPVELVMITHNIPLGASTSTIPLGTQ